jgi:hypothetical protein
LVLLASILKGSSPERDAVRAVVFIAGVGRPSKPSVSTMRLAGIGDGMPMVASNRCGFTNPTPRRRC